MTRGARFGLVVVIALSALAVFAPELSLQDPAELALAENLRGPSLAHPLGQDRLGRDIWSRIVYGSRVSIAVGFSAVAFSLAAGVAVGLLAGISGGWIDELIMRVVDVLLAFPGLL